MIRTYKIEVLGRVQMVGFRWFTQRLAKQFNIKGNVKNTITGTVEIIAEGEEENLNLFVGQVKKGPRAANVTNLVKEEITTKKEYSTFDIIG
ncbi:MAG: acylphosphatase [Candidatus Marinimicrobia bacterium]|jgi:acylphosphatase|nr:acylphosphatase [Candidatus Neomarinimicrobiota bacterium]